MTSTVLYRHLVTKICRRVVTAALAAVLGLVTVVGNLIGAQAQTYKESVLHKFTGQPDGANPYAGLILDAKGNLYGTTNLGGNPVCSGGCGTVFKVDPSGKETVLHSIRGGPDGTYPYAGLILDAKGNLYGTTSAGGDFNCAPPSGCGTVFKVSSKGTETPLHTFTGGADGETPYAGLILDAKGNLYGTTSAGGDFNCAPPSGCGTVFKVSSKGTETPLHTFTGGADGETPYAGLILDAKGNLYGTTWNGGAYGQGVVFKVGSKGKETVLHSFTGGADGGNPYAGLILDTKGNLYGTTFNGGADGQGVVFKVDSKGKETVLADGGDPYGGLILDTKGNLYGTTYYGGNSACSSGCGTVFKLDLLSGKETVLYSFAGPDGEHPYAGLILDAKGNLYGTTSFGGTSGNGVVFKVSSKGKETVVHSFTGGADGGRPYAGLILDAKGDLYGTTWSGGNLSDCQGFGCGVVFKLTP